MTELIEKLLPFQSSVPAHELPGSDVMRRRMNVIYDAYQNVVSLIPELSPVESLPVEPSLDEGTIDQSHSSSVTPAVEAGVAHPATNPATSQLHHAQTAVDAAATPSDVLRAQMTEVMKKAA